MIQVTAPVESHIFQTQFHSLPCDSGAYQLALLYLVDLLRSNILIAGRGGSQRLAAVIVGMLATGRGAIDRVSPATGSAVGRCRPVSSRTPRRR